MVLATCHSILCPRAVYKLSFSHPLCGSVKLGPCDRCFGQEWIPFPFTDLLSLNISCSFGPNTLFGPFLPEGINILTVPMRYRDEKFYWTYQPGVRWLDDYIGPDSMTHWIIEKSQGFTDVGLLRISERLRAYGVKFTRLCKI